MDKIYDNCCGIDVPKELIVACFRKGNKEEKQVSNAIQEVTGIGNTSAQTIISVIGAGIFLPVWDYALVIIRVPKNENLANLGKRMYFCGSCWLPVHVLP